MTRGASFMWGVSRALLLSGAVEKDVRDASHHLGVLGKKSNGHSGKAARGKLAVGDSHFVMVIANDLEDGVAVLWVMNAGDHGVAAMTQQPQREETA